MRYLVFVALLMCFLNAYTQKITVSAYVKDALTSEALMYSVCYDSISTLGTVSNSMGFFTFETNKNQKVALKISYLGYQTKYIKFVVTQDTTLNISLDHKNHKISEVCVTDYASIHKQDVLGKITVAKNTIQSLPSFVGVPDVMKAITFIPGVSGGREGYSNIYVRGGDRGQNLILLDGIKLYNTNHVGGFLSVLNSNVLKHVDVYKGGFPARYGGRTSSVIDTYVKDGDKEKIRGRFNIGFLSSGLMLEGPIAQELIFVVAARTSYFNLLNDAISGESDDNAEEVESFKYTIYDVNSKLTWQPNNNHKISLSYFTGNDTQKSISAYANGLIGNKNEKYRESFGMAINTAGASLLYKGKLSSKWYTENLVAYSKYNNDLDSYIAEEIDKIKDIEEVNSYSNIKDYSVKSRFDYYQSNRYTLRGGIEYSYYQFVPSLQRQYYENTSVDILKDTLIGFRNKLHSTEAALFFENEIDITPKLRLNLGLRGVGYYCKDTSFYKLEPRFSLRWLVSEVLSFKANYTSINQFNHVLVNNVYGFDREIWFSATKELMPQNSNQVSLGVFYGNEDLLFDISMEAYYKKMNNLQEYRSPVMDENDLDNITDIVAKNGIGKSRGFEFFVQKEFQRLNLNLNYTLAWSDRKFDELNNGNWYPFIYDRRHDISFVALFKISKKYSMASNFIYTSGASVTLPVGYSTHDDLAYHYYVYDGLNNRKLPPYHRLDLSVTRKTETKKGNISKWTFNIFNLYARQNPVYVYYDSNTGKVHQKSMFSILPTISYSFEF